MIATVAAMGTKRNEIRKEGRREEQQKRRRRKRRSCSSSSSSSNSSRREGNEGNGHRSLRLVPLIYYVLERPRVDCRAGSSSRACGTTRSDEGVLLSTRRRPVIHQPPPSRSSERSSDSVTLPVSLSLSLSLPFFLSLSHAQASFN